MRFYLDYIWHYVSSHSTHGTHSPFVYGLADKAIYSDLITYSIGGAELIPRSYRPLVLRLLVYLKRKSILQYKKESGTGGDVLFIRAADLRSDIVQTYLSQDYLIVVGDLYTTYGDKQAWKTAADHPAVTVSIDLFHVGLLIKRAGQVKEHFRLRYPHWIK